jgi:cytochrome c2
MRSLLIIAALFAGLALYSCGGGSKENNENNSGAVSNAGSNSSATMENNAPSVDVNAFSKSKGVGKFTDVKVSSTIDAKMAAKGEELFETNCTACHHYTSEKLIGPGLKGITKIRTPEWIMNMITNPIQMTQQDPVAHELFTEFNETQMTNQGLTDEQARDVLEFLRKNDSQ